MLKKRRGSTLVITIITLGILLTIGVALLSMSVSEYKMRQSQNKRIRNLYGSESGLDVAYDIIVRDFDSAAQFGAYRAKQLEVDDANEDSPYKESYKNLKKQLEEIEADEDMTAIEKMEARKDIHKQMDILINNEFKRSFKIFLYDSTITESDDRNERNGTYDYSKPNMLKYSIEGKKSDGVTRNYIDGLAEKEADLTQELEDHNDFHWNSVDLVTNKEGSEPITEPTIKVDIPTFPEIETSSEDIKSDSEKYNKNYEIRLNSTFVTSKGNVNVNGENRRTVEAIYKLEVPNYKDVVFGEKEIIDYSIYNDKGLAIGGNMTVGEESGGKEFDLEVNGNIFVEGKQEGTSLENKYNGGISLKNVNEVEFNGNVVTGKTFNIRSDVKEANISKNLYAANVYAGEKDNRDCENSSLNVAKDMVLNNDLTLNAFNTNITVNNFYGINDRKVEESQAGKTNKITGSSSIIVNNYKKKDVNPSSITINEDALIMGVAYIATGNGYATGESVGVKGNYRAYSEHVDSDDNKNTDDDTDNNLEFDADHDEDSPLYLVNGTVIAKNEHFYNYWNNKSGVNSAEAGGVHFGNPDNIKSVGSVVYKDGDETLVKKGKGSIEDLNLSSAKQREYALRVYDMNMEDYTGTLGDSYRDLYNNDSPKRKTVAGLMNFPSSKEGDRFLDDNAIQIGNKDSGFGIFNPSSDRNISIVEAASGSGIEVEDLDGDTITISVPNDKTLNVFIATAGNVTIDGKVNIKGNIIAKGNLDIKGTGKKTITYDEGLVKNLQMIDKELFFEVFGGDEYSKSEPEKKEIVVQYDLTKFLKDLLWKLLN